MEFKQVVGLRRSVRFWNPWQPIEPEKLQAVLEAIYRAPRVLEVDFLRVAVMHRDELSEEDLEAMKTPTTTTQIELCPTYIFVYADLEALSEALDGKNLEEMIEVGALNESHGWTHSFIHETIVPQVYQDILDDEDSVPTRFRTPDGMREGPSFSRRLGALGRTQIGIAQAFGLLAAVDQGLGVQLSGVGTDVPKRVMGIPDSWITASPMLIGYAAEGMEAGGQRPREPLTQDFHEGRYGSAFESDPAVVEQLRDEGMFQAPAPLPWRRDELRRLARMFGLPE
ncbi:MAG: hypothetical protein V3S31_01390 [Dehalococcoidia bacterium]